MDLEALTSCARKAAEQLPFLPRPGRHAETIAASELADEVEARRNYGRLQSLVFAAADAAEQVLDACEDAIDCAAAPDNDDDGGDDDDGGSGGSGSGGPAGNGQPPGGPGALTGGKGGPPPIQKTTPVQPIPTIPPLA